MPEADASSSLISFIEETTWGTIPTTPVMKSIRQTGNGLTPSLNKAISDEITPSASIGDVVITSGGAEGDVNFEPSYGEWFDTVLEHIFRAGFDGFGILKGSNGSKSMTLERIINVATTPFYFRYPGCRTNTLEITLDATSTSPITATVNVMGKTELTGTAILSGETYVPANTNPVMSMPELRHLYVEINGVSKTACFTTLTLNANNNLRTQQGKCTATTTYPDNTAKGEGYGRRELTLAVGYYFTDLDYTTMFTANTSGLFRFVLSDGVRGYLITLPRCKIMDSSIPIEGNNTDVIQNMTVQALYDSSNQTEIIIEKIGNLAVDAGIKLTGTSPSPNDAGTYYKNGAMHNSKAVYASGAGTKAIWWSTIGSKWYVTTYATIGTVPTLGWSNATALAPTGAFVAVGAATGTLSGESYAPTV